MRCCKYPYNGVSLFRPKSPAPSSTLCTALGPVAGIKRYVRLLALAAVRRGTLIRGFSLPPSLGARVSAGFSASARRWPNSLPGQADLAVPCLLLLVLPAQRPPRKPPQPAPFVRWSVLRLPFPTRHHTHTHIHIHPLRQPATRLNVVVHQTTHCAVSRPRLRPSLRPSMGSWPPCLLSLLTSPRTACRAHRHEHLDERRSPEPQWQRLPAHE